MTKEETINAISALAILYSTIVANENANLLQKIGEKLEKLIETL